MARQPTKHRPKKAIALKTNKVAAKKPANTKPATAPVTVSIKLPSVIRLSKQAGRTLWQHKRLFGGIIAIYGLLNIIFVSGLSGNIDIASVRNQFGNRLAGGLVAYTQLLSGSGSSSGQSSPYQLILFMMVSLALVWALRQIYAGNKVHIKTAYYAGMYPLVPCLLVLLVMVLQLLPFLAGAGIYQLVVSNGIAASALEIGLWGLLALAAALVSAYFITASLFGFYIATLPDMPPIKALKLARKLVKGRRWTVLRKLLFLPLVLLVLTAVTLLPLILVVPALAPVLLLILTPLLIAFGHSYLYSLYRGLMNE